MYLSRLRERLRTHVPELLSERETMNEAAVAAVLRHHRDQTEILLIRRAKRPEDPWSGQIAFPGGRKDSTDPDAIATAIRETQEETGIDLRAYGEFVGRLDDVQAIARGLRQNMVIAPHVFLLESEPAELTPDESEVDEIIWTPIEPMIRGESSTHFSFTYEGQAIAMPGFQVGAHVVWGLTYRMLHLLFHHVKTV